MKKALSVFLILTAVVAGLSCAEDITFPGPKGYVNDFAGVIDSVSAGNISALARDLKLRNGCEISVVTVNSTAPLDPKSYAVSLFKKWGLGQKGYDNGLLILFAGEQKRVEIEVGYGIEGIITDGFSGRVLDEFAVPAFRQGKFGQGLYETASALAQKLAKEYTGEKPKPKKNNLPRIILLVVLVLIAAFYLLMKHFGEKGFNAFMGLVIGGILGFIFAGMIGAIIGAAFGALSSQGNIKPGNFPGGFTGGFGGGAFGGGSGGGFGGFSGGGSGGGGAGRSW